VYVRRYRDGARADPRTAFMAEATAMIALTAALESVVTASLSRNPSP